MRLLFVGDTMLGRLVNDALKDLTPAYPWGDTLPLFHNADWRMCNLECAISDRGEPWTDTRKVFHFRTDTQNVEVLNKARIDCVSLGNNHALDYGYTALSDTLCVLEQNNIESIGAGENGAEASEMAVMTIGDTTIGVLGFTDNMPEWEAGEQKAGVNYLPLALEDPRMEAFLGQVEVKAKQVDLLVVSAHWGGNWGYEAPGNHQAVAHALIDRGADIIHGHSAHIVRGVEVYKNRLILYSTGDFIDDYAVDPRQRNDRSFIFEVSAGAEGVEGLRMHPTVVRRFQAQRARGADMKAVVETMTRLCEALGTIVHWDEGEGVLVIGGTH